MYDRTTNRTIVHIRDLGKPIFAIRGVLMFVFSPIAPLALDGVLLWGVGASLGFPVGMSAAADDAPTAAAGRPLPDEERRDT